MSCWPTDLQTQREHSANLAYKEPKYKGAKGSLFSPASSPVELEHIIMKAILKRAYKNEAQEPVGQESLEQNLVVSSITHVEVFNPLHRSYCWSLTRTRDGLSQVLDLLLVFFLQNDLTGMGLAGKGQRH